MNEPILLEVVTPEHRIFSAHVAELQFPTAHNGYYGILPYHTPLITPVGSGVVSFLQHGEPHSMTVFGGFAEVGPDRVSILACTSETSDMLDRKQVEDELHQAQVLLKEAQSPEEGIRAQSLLEASLIRLQVLDQADKSREH